VNIRNSKQVCRFSGEITSLDNGPFSPLKQHSEESKAEQLGGKNFCHPTSELQSKHLPPNAKPASQEHTWFAAATTGESLKQSDLSCLSQRQSLESSQPPFLQKNKVKPPRKRNGNTQPTGSLCLLLLGCCLQHYLQRRGPPWLSKARTFLCKVLKKGIWSKLVHQGHRHWHMEKNTLKHRGQALGGSGK
jgi:hypothetical protein